MPRPPAFHKGYAQHQVYKAIAAIHRAELGLANGRLDFPDSWRLDWEPCQCPPHWDTALAAPWPDLPEGCTWWGRRLMYLKLLRIRREMRRLSAHLWVE